jgi:anti-sigma B factor antagonist
MSEAIIWYGGAWVTVGDSTVQPRHEPSLGWSYNRWMIMQPRDKFFSALLGIRAAESSGVPGSGEVEVVSAGNDLDANGMEAVRTAVMSSAQRGNWSYVLDLSRVRSMDSPGLGMLVSALRTIRDLGGSVGLVTDSPRLQRILELCARDRSCSIFNRTADAVKALTGSGQPKTAA